MKQLIKKVLRPFKRFFYLAKLPIMKEYYAIPIPCPKDKSKWSIICDQLRYIWKWGEPNGMYFLYEFQKKSRSEQNQYMAYDDFRTQRNKMNLRESAYLSTAEHFNYICLLRDKFYFGQVLTSLGFPTPKNLFVINGRTGLYKKLPENGFNKIENIISESFDGYCKLIIGECGNGVFRLQINDGEIFVDSIKSSYEDFMSKLENGLFLVQERIIQHSQLSKIYPKSVNTMRIITCLDSTGNAHLLDAVLRVGAHGNTVDNWAQGGLDIAINDNGCLGNEGCYEFVINGKLRETKHPDTGVVFADCTLPFYKDAIKLAKELHELFYKIPTIGWDVAITENGPCFIEGNDNYEISLNQVASGGLKEKWDNIFRLS